MNKEETIENIMNIVSKNGKLKEEMMFLSTDQCSSEGIFETELRNELFVFLGLSLALLSYSEIIILNYESDFKESSDSLEITSLTEKIQKNKILIKLITDIVNHETDENQSKVRHHIFLLVSLPVLASRNMISVNNDWNNKSPY